MIVCVPAITPRIVVLERRPAASASREWEKRQDSYRFAWKAEWRPPASRESTRACLSPAEFPLDRLENVA
jgi:hypothetical protein